MTGLLMPVGVKIGQLWIRSTHQSALAPTILRLQGKKSTDGVFHCNSSPFCHTELSKTLYIITQSPLRQRSCYPSFFRFKDQLLWKRSVFSSSYLSITTFNPGLTSNALKYRCPRDKKKKKICSCSAAAFGIVHSQKRNSILPA